MMAHDLLFMAAADITALASCRLTAEEADAHSVPFSLTPPIVAGDVDQYEQQHDSHHVGCRAAVEEVMNKQFHTTS